jgi:hypothetical protein
VTRTQMVVVCAVIVMSFAIAVAIILISVAQSRARQLGPEHPGATISTPPLPPLPPDEPTLVTPIPHPWPTFVPAAPARPVGRHHEDTVETVPAGWMPPTDAQRLRALEQTRIIPRFQTSPGHKAGGA